LVLTVKFLLENELQPFFKMVYVISEKTVGSVVVLAIRIKDNKLVALKFIVDKSKATREVTILKLLKGKNHTIKLLDHFYIQSADLHCLVLPYYEGGKVPTADNEIRSYMTQLLKALQYCHKENIIHRDVNLNNILFQRSKCLDVVLADFDSAVSQSDPLFRTGTLPYMAPELLGPWGDDYGFLVDIWSAGVVFVELLLEKPLFCPKDMEDMAGKVKHFLDSEDFWKESKFPKDLEEVLKCMLTKEKNRKNASELLKMQYFRQCK